MREFKERVAVITGAASGIGRGLADRCAKEGMKVVLADIEENALIQAEEEMKATGATVMSVITDVSKEGDVKSLAEKSVDAFGDVHLLFNNAGVGGGTSAWESTVADWEWIMGVNLWGVIHCVRTFVPIMLKQQSESHIVNTASMAGLMSGPYSAIYKVTKHGVVSLSETLYHELKQKNASINVSVLCPGYIDTQIVDCERNRPAKLQNDPGIERNRREKTEYQFMEQFMRKAVQDGMSPQGTADFVFDAIKAEKFYILANPAYFKDFANMRAEDIIQERNPTNPLSAPLD